MATLTKYDSQYLDTFLKASNDIFLLLDSAGNVLGASRALETMFGYEPGELQGKLFSQLARPLTDVLSLDQPRPGEFELEFFNKSGETLATRWLFEPCGSRDGGLAVFLREILFGHPQERADYFFSEAVRERILDDLPVGVIVTDQAARIVLYNRTQEKITGISRAEALGGLLFVDYASNAPLKVKESAVEALSKGVKVKEHEFDYTDRHGASRRFRSRVSTLYGPGGQILGLIQTLEDVSRQHQLEQEVRRTRDFLERVVESSPDPIITTDNSGRITFNNRAAEQLFGSGQVGGLDSFIKNLYLGGHREAAQVIKLLLESEGTIENYETFLRSAEGRDIPVSMTASLLFDDQRKIVGTMGIIRNLSVVRKLESEILQSEHYLATIIRESADAIISLDREGVIRTWNRGAESIFGFTGEEITGQRLDRIIPHESSIPGELQWIELQLAEHGVLRNYVTERVAEDGRRVVVEETSTLLKNNQGDITGRSIIYRDITQRIQLEEKLHRHIADLSIINEINDSLLSTMDLNEVLGIILIGVTAAQGLGFNRAFLLLIDQQENTLVGKMAIGPSNAWEAGIIWNELYQKRQTLRELLDSYKSSVIEHDIHVNEVVRKIHIPLTDTENQLVRCVLEKKSLNIQRGDQENSLPGWLVELLGIDTMAMVPMVMKERSVGLLMADNMINQKPISDDSVRMLRVFANLASQAIENSRLYMSLEEKVADLDAAYTQLKKSRDRLVRAERLSAVGEVATNLAHEIRNPLVSVGGFARSLQKELGKDDPRREKVRIIIEEVDRLERFLKNTMAFAKPMVPNFKPKDPNKLIQQTFMMMDQELEHSGVEIVLELMDNPPLVELDKDQVRQVLLNIFRNGLEAMPEGGRLTVSTRGENGMFIISVADTGMGIEQSDMEQLFTAFFTTKSTGSGLGLSISSQIIKNHGGTIGFSSRKGEGTVFHITLPITHQAAMKEDQ